MNPFTPGQSWQEIKKELMNRWKELTDHELEQTKGNERSIAELLEKKVGLAIDDASQRYAEIASRYKLFDEPKQQEPVPQEEKPPRILELRPRKPKSPPPPPERR